MIKFKYLNIRDVISIMLIIFSTLLYFVFNEIPEGFKTIDLCFFEIGSFAFPDIAQLIQYLKMKFLILIFALIWYFSCKHCWESAILVIIAIELSKVITALNSTNYALDEIDYIISLPITIPIIIILAFISKKLNAYNLTLNLRSTLDDEIDTVFHELNGKSTDGLMQLKQDLNEAKKTKSNVDAEVQLKKLIAIRDQYYKTEFF